MNKLILITAFIILLFSCTKTKKSTLPVKESSEKYQVKIDSLLNTYLEANNFMGSIELSYDGKTVYKNAVGFSDIKASKKVDSVTKYRIGSASKIFTATLIFKALEENKLTLNKTIETFFPKLKNASKITIAHLLQHRSGIHNFTKDNFLEYHTQYKSTSEMLSMISNYKSDFEPNEKGDYSNSNYFLLSLILEKTYKSTYKDLIQDKICKPLKLYDTYVGNEININNNEAYSYIYDKEWSIFPETNMSILKGSGSIVSTSKDINTYIEALFTGKLISIKSLSLMKTIKDHYGMGLFRYKIHDRQGYGHRGHIDGFRSTSIYFPEEKLSFTLLSNASKIDVNNIYSEILNLYFNDVIVDISETEIEKFVGKYVSLKDKTHESTFIKDKKTLIHLIKDEFKEPLVYKGNNRFIMNQVYAESISFIFSQDGKQLTFKQGDYKDTLVKKTTP